MMRRRKRPNLHRRGLLSDMVSTPKRLFSKNFTSKSGTIRPNLNKLKTGRISFCNAYGSDERDLFHTVILIDGKHRKTRYPPRGNGDKGQFDSYDPNHAKLQFAHPLQTHVHAHCIHRQRVVVQLHVEEVLRDEDVLHPLSLLLFQRQLTLNCLTFALAAYVQHTDTAPSNHHLRLLVPLGLALALELLLCAHLLIDNAYIYLLRLSLSLGLRVAIVTASSSTRPLPNCQLVYFEDAPFAKLPRALCGCYAALRGSALAMIRLRFKPRD